MPVYRISINRQAVGQTLAVLVALLLGMSMLGQISRFEFGHDYVFGLVQLFNVDGERNIPTFFTVMVALSSAALLAVIGIGSKGHEKNDSRYWFALATGFVFLGYDEAFQVHEKMIVPMRALLGNSELGFFYFGWVVPGIAGVCVLALFFLRFLFRLPAQTRRLMLLAGFIYLAGCLGMELVDGKYVEAHGQNLMYSVLVTIEEGLEMAGLSMLVVTLLGHIGEATEKVEFHIEAAPHPVLVAQPEHN